MAFNQWHPPKGFGDDKLSAGDPHRAFRILTLETLLRFCREHGGVTEPLEQCLNALEADDVKGALAIYERIPWGGRMGCFEDWYPPVLQTDQLDPYVVFLALAQFWRDQMESLRPPSK